MVINLGIPGAKPLHELILTYYHLDHQKHSVYFIYTISIMVVYLLSKIFRYSIFSFTGVEIEVGIMILIFTYLTV